MSGLVNAMVGGIRGYMVGGICGYRYVLKDQYGQTVTAQDC
jgi:hypothetical protein